MCSSILGGCEKKVGLLFGKKKKKKKKNLVNRSGLFVWGAHQTKQTVFRLTFCSTGKCLGFCGCLGLVCVCGEAKVHLLPCASLQACCFVCLVV